MHWGAGGPAAVLGLSLVGTAVPSSPSPPSAPCGHWCRGPSAQGVIKAEETAGAGAAVPQALLSSPPLGM